MNVATILKSKGNSVETVRPDWTVKRFVEHLDTCGVGALVVSADGATVDGIASERDVIRVIAKRGAAILDRPVSEIMIPDVVTVSRDTAIADAMATMTDRRIRHLPVLDDEQLVGIVSIGDLVKYRIEEAEFEARSMREYITAG